jgi:hypothetical protein
MDAEHCCKRDVDQRNNSFILSLDALMKFTVKEPGGFKHTVMATEQHQHFEEGNAYDSVVHHLSDNEVEMFRQAGWVRVEGHDEVDRDPTRVVTLQPDSVRHTVSDNGN